MTPKQALAAFIKTLPPDAKTGVIAVDHDEYIAESLQHPFIQQQIKAGIYEPETFADEFLSVARTFAKERMIEIDAHLISSHMRGVPLYLAEAYVQRIALHEYHHVVYHQEPVSVEEQVQREIACDVYLASCHPEVVQLAEQAERQSTTIQRVYSRISRLSV